MRADTFNPPSYYLKLPETSDLFRWDAQLRADLDGMFSRLGRGHGRLGVNTVESHGQAGVRQVFQDRVSDLGPEPPVLQLLQLGQVAHLAHRKAGNLLRLGRPIDLGLPANLRPRGRMLENLPSILFPQAWSRELGLARPFRLSDHFAPLRELVILARRDHHPPVRAGEAPDQTADDRYHCARRALAITRQLRSEERRVGKECRSRWSPY